MRCFLLKNKKSCTLERRTDWVVTLPATVLWAKYERELQVVADFSSVLNFRVPFKPSAKKGDRCYVLYLGQVRGWMEIVGVEYRTHGFTCTTTGEFWKPGNYIQRSGPWHAVACGITARGFQGIRRMTTVQDAGKSSMPDRCVDCGRPRRFKEKFCSECGNPTEATCS